MPFGAVKHAEMHRAGAAVSSADAGDTSQIGLRVRNCPVRSNTVEGFYSIFKRGMKGRLSALPKR